MSLLDQYREMCRRAGLDIEPQLAKRQSGKFIYIRTVGYVWKIPEAVPINQFASEHFAELVAEADAARAP